MKVICIDDSYVSRFGGQRRLDFYVEVGKIYNVSSQSSNVDVGVVYDLLEDPKGGRWSASRFIEISEIDEKEFIRNYNKQLA